MSIRIKKLTLGEFVLARRKELKISGRSLAATLEVTPSYISDIEHNRRVPSEDLLLRMAPELKGSEFSEAEFFSECMALGGRLTADDETKLKSDPLLIKVVRTLLAANFNMGELRRLQKAIEKGQIRNFLNEANNVY